MKPINKHKHAFWPGLGSYLITYIIVCLDVRSARDEVSPAYLPACLCGGRAGRRARMDMRSCLRWAAVSY